MPSPDLSEFEKLSHPKKRLCPLAGALDSVGDERAALAAALSKHKGEISGSAIVTWLERRGVTVNQQFVASHRRRTCTCFDD
jgi:hypothetical protein